jgi:hypothetical protein
MSPLRNRVGSRLREPFGKAGLSVAVIALVFAMLGGAYAATKLNGTQKKEVEKIAKKFQGTGPAGAAGPVGAKGDTGAKGDNGTAGSNGTSATTTSFAGVKGSCTEGGVEVKSASPTVNVCNGVKGANGTFSTEPLPKGETLTGVWAASTLVTGESAGPLLIPISFPIQVSPAPTADMQFEPSSTIGIVFKAGSPEADFEFETHCPGSAANPEATEGYLCIYQGEVVHGGAPPLAPNPLYEPASSHGVVAFMTFQSNGGYAKGSWAVTAS